MILIQLVTMFLWMRTIMPSLDHEAIFKAYPNAVIS